MSNNSSNEDERFEKPSRMRSVSTTIPINNEIKLKINSSHRRKSISLINDSNSIQSNNSEINSTIHFEKVKSNKNFISIKIIYFLI